MAARFAAGSASATCPRCKARSRVRWPGCSLMCPAIAAAGRTDTGVHATGQVAQCDMTRDWDAFRLMEALNHHLKPQPVAVLACARVDDDFHARFSALERRYTFRLLARRAPPALDAGFVWHIRHTLDLQAMQAGRRICWGSTISPRFAPASARPRPRSRRWTLWTLTRAACPAAWNTAFTCARGPSCITRCAALSARWNGSARARGRRTMLARRLLPETALPAGRSARPMACA